MKVDVFTELDNDWIKFPLQTLSAPKQ